MLLALYQLLKEVGHLSWQVSVLARSNTICKSFLRDWGIAVLSERAGKHYTCCQVVFSRRNIAKSFFRDWGIAVVVITFGMSRETPLFHSLARTLLLLQGSLGNPDPREKWKEGLGNGLGRKCTLRNVISVNYLPANADFYIPHSGCTLISGKSLTLLFS